MRTVQSAVLRHLTGPAISSGQRWAHVAKLLNDTALDLTDRVAGSLLLLYGQPLSRIAAMTTRQITRRDDTTLLLLGRHEVPAPAPLADKGPFAWGALTDLLTSPAQPAGSGCDQRRHGALGRRRSARFHGGILCGYGFARHFVQRSRLRFLTSLEILLRAPMMLTALTARSSDLVSASSAR